MEVLLIRHAIAEPRVTEGGTQPDDALRELTPKGRKRMKRIARGLGELVSSIDLLAASPLVRAQQTAEYVSDIYDAKIVTVNQLSPGTGPDPVLEWLRTVQSSGTVALVGHEPGLSALAVHLTTGHDYGFLTLGKGGACLMEVPSGVLPGTGRLTWVATPGQLRRLGKC